jgi:hypothetical protein
MNSPISNNPSENMRKLHISEVTGKPTGMIMPGGPLGKALDRTARSLLALKLQHG